MQKRSQINIRIDPRIRNDIDLTARELGISVSRYIVMIHNICRTNHSVQETLEPLRKTKFKEEK